MNWEDVKTFARKYFPENERLHNAFKEGTRGANYVESFIADTLFHSQHYGLPVSKVAAMIKEGKTDELLAEAEERLAIEDFCGRWLDRGYGALPQPEHRVTTPRRVPLKGAEPH